MDLIWIKTEKCVVNKDSSGVKGYPVINKMAIVQI
jgi:hypothetical protein